MARWLSFPNIVVSSRSPGSLIVAIERNLANLGEARLVEQGHGLLDRRADFVGAGMVGREAELFRLRHECRIADDLPQGLLQQIDALPPRAPRSHHPAAASR